MSSTPPSEILTVLFVCLGNICRSPMAQGVLQQQLTAAGLAGQVAADSCGTAAFNVGKQPDARAIAAASRAGIDITRQVARQIDDADYHRCQYIVAMDRNNLSNVQAWAPPAYAGEMKLLLDYVPRQQHAQIADPYYAAEGEFDNALQQIGQGTAHLLDYIRAQHAL